MPGTGSIGVEVIAGFLLEVHVAMSVDAMGCFPACFSGFCPMAYETRLRHGVVVIEDGPQGLKEGLEMTQADL